MNAYRNTILNTLCSLKRTVLVRTESVRKTYLNIYVDGAWIFSFDDIEFKYEWVPIKTYRSSISSICAVCRVGKIFDSFRAYLRNKVF